MGYFEEASADVTFQEVFQRLQESDAFIYPALLEVEQSYRLSLIKRGARLLEDSVFKEARFRMHAMAEHAGSPIFAPSSMEELATVFRRVAAELRSQYTVSYHSNNPVRDGRWRELKVTIAGHPEYGARTRKGYRGP